MGVLEGDQRSRVLHVVTDTDRRGAQIFATDLCRALGAEGAPGTVVALRRGKRAAVLDLPVLGRGASDPRALLALRRAMARSDVVVAHGSSTLRACVAAGWGLGVPTVYRNISDPAFWTATPLRRLRVRGMLRRIDHVVALYSGGADYLSERLGVSPERVTVIPNAVRPDSFRQPTKAERTSARETFGLPADATVLLFAAALQREKHPGTAVQALGHLPADTWLLMVGEGACRREVATAAARVAPGRVVMTGQIEDMAAAYWASDVMVLPSEGEGLPAVLIEAGLCGVPAVASASGGNRDIVLDRSTGRVVAHGDAKQLADGVLEVLDRRGEYGDQAARHCAETFDLAAVAARWNGVLSVAGCGAGGAAG